MARLTVSTLWCAIGFCVCLLLESCGGLGTQPNSASAPVSPTPQSLTGANADLFGMHIHRIGAGTPWPNVAFIPAWRLWDAGVSWRELEPSRGIFTFTLLDQYVSTAEQHNTELLLTLAYTPQWASQRPFEASNGGPGASAPPANIADWNNFVTAIVTRYKGRITAYEILNEPNLPSYFTGAVADQFAMLQNAYQIIKQIDPAATVVGPGYMGNGFLQLDQLLTMGGDQFMDVVAYHFYVFPGKPEAIQVLIDPVLNVLAKHNLTKPLWDTEIGFGPTQTFTDENQQAAYFARTILLHWRDHIARAYWYAWDNHLWAHLWMTEPDNVTLTKAGTAFSILSSWISAATLNGCSTDATTLNLCSATMPDGRLVHILWMTNGQTSFNPPSAWQATSIQDLGGTEKPLGSAIIATESPVFIH
jgi:hypothetical protein